MHALFVRAQNVDAGTMSPFEHGEVFVLDDGGEADLDLGNYERFLVRAWRCPACAPMRCGGVAEPCRVPQDTTLTRDHNITTGSPLLLQQLLLWFCTHDALLTLWCRRQGLPARDRGGAARGLPREDGAGARAPVATAHAHVG